jgi:hypothetical protein
MSEDTSTSSWETFSPQMAKLSASLVCSSTIESSKGSTDLLNSLSSNETRKSLIDRLLAGYRKLGVHVSRQLHEGLFPADAFGLHIAAEGGEGVVSWS